MIWQEMMWNGQQKPLAMPALLASDVEAVAAAASTRVIASTLARPLPTTPIPFAHFYIGRTERLQKNK